MTEEERIRIRRLIIRTTSLVTLARVEYSEKHGGEIDVLAEAIQCLELADSYLKKGGD